MKDGMEKKIDTSIAKAEYCSTTAIMFELAKPKIIRGA